ncbi:SDR family oxidoreductase [Mycolicibacterium boenickei]|nr:SDR family oxidoreductase [Mycolicibacterium boenickei]
MLEVDLVAPFDLAKLCLPAMRDVGGGSIVNVTSIAAINTTSLSIPQAAYCAAKGGLVKDATWQPNRWREQRLRLSRQTWRGSPFNPSSAVRRCPVSTVQRRPIQSGRRAAVSRRSPRRCAVRSSIRR